MHVNVYRIMYFMNNVNSILPYNLREYSAFFSNCGLYMDHTNIMQPVCHTLSISDLNCLYFVC